MFIPPSALSAEVLDHLLEEFATLDGTYVGDGPEPSLAEKIAALRGQLKSGELRITFDEESESVSLLHDVDVARAVAPPSEDHDVEREGNPDE